MLVHERWIQAFDAGLTTFIYGRINFVCPALKEKEELPLPACQLYADLSS